MSPWKYPSAAQVGLQLEDVLTVGHALLEGSVGGQRAVQQHGRLRIDGVQDGTAPQDRPGLGKPGDDAGGAGGDRPARGIRQRPDRLGLRDHAPRGDGRGGHRHAPGPRRLDAPGSATGAALAALPRARDERDADVSPRGTLRCPPGWRPRAREGPIGGRILDVVALLPQTRRLLELPLRRSALPAFEGVTVGGSPSSAMHLEAAALISGEDSWMPLPGAGSATSRPLERRQPASLRSYASRATQKSLSLTWFGLLGSGVAVSFRRHRRSTRWRPWRAARQGRRDGERDSVDEVMPATQEPRAFTWRCRNASQTKRLAAATRGSRPR